MKHKLVAIEKMVFGHSLISNTCPKGLTLDKFNHAEQEAKKEIEKLGLFDSAAPNFSSYYPNATAEDLKPKDEDFVYPIYRALSEVLVRRFAPVDFSINGVLRASMDKLYGQTVYPNHEQLIGNHLGVVNDVQWQDSYTVGDIVVPAGINSRLKIDGKSNPSIARGMMMDPPSIHSTSVTVEFAWEKSHNLSDEEFFTKLGSYDSKGALIKRNVTEVLNYHEISLVPHGADSFAMKIGADGKIINPQYAKSVYKFGSNHEEENYQNGKIHFIDYKINHKESLSQSTIPLELNNNDQESLDNKISLNMKNILISLLLLSGKFTQEGLDKLSDDELGTTAKDSLGKIFTEVKELDNLKLKVTETETTVTDLTQKLADKETAITNLTADATIGKLALKTIREEALKNYNLAMINKPEDSMIKLISESSFETATVLCKQYATQVEEKFTSTCQDCNSTNVSKMSAAAGKEGLGGDDKTKFVPKTNEEVMASLGKEKNPVKYLGL